MTDEVQVKTLLTQTTIVQTPEDAEIGARMRQLIHRVLDDVEDILDFGSPRDRMSLIKSFLQPAGRMVGIGAGSQREEARVAFEQLMSEMRDVPELETLVTDKGIIDVDARTVATATHDQDEGDGPHEPGRDDW